MGLKLGAECEDSFYREGTPEMVTHILGHLHYVKIMVIPSSLMIVTEILLLPTRDGYDFAAYRLMETTTDCVVVVHS